MINNNSENISSKLVLLKKKTKERSVNNPNNIKSIDINNSDVDISEKASNFKTQFMNYNNNEIHNKKVDSIDNNNLIKIERFENKNQGNDKVNEINSISLSNHSNGNVNQLNAVVSDQIKQKLHWMCDICNNECLPIQSESRCLCGHRFKVHEFKQVKNTFSCTTKLCKCQHFFYIVAEGSWMLRCRCKHKPAEHDCSKLPYKCLKCQNCLEFDSPWVCNCGHGWALHHQTEINNSINVNIKKKIYSIRQDGSLPSEGFT